MTAAVKSKTQLEIERLKAENEALKKQAEAGKQLSLKVSQKGAVSIYGLGRFPVTLYKGQWLRLLEIVDQIHQFITDHDSELATKN